LICVTCEYKRGKVSCQYIPKKSSLVILEDLLYTIRAFCCSSDLDAADICSSERCRSSALISFLVGRCLLLRIALLMMLAAQLVLKRSNRAQ
ncbi:hypothetical protein COCCADRAFT_81646, partial [Bipolaris zeicola 26-R-13]